MRHYDQGTLCECQITSSDPAKSKDRKISGRARVTDQLLKNCHLEAELVKGPEHCGAVQVKPPASKTAESDTLTLVLSHSLFFAVFFGSLFYWSVYLSQVRIGGRSSNPFQWFKFVERNQIKVNRIAFTTDPFSVIEPKKRPSAKII